MSGGQHSSTPSIAMGIHSISQSLTQARHVSSVHNKAFKINVQEKYHLAVKNFAI